MFLCHGLALGNKVYTNLIKPASSLPTTDIYISKPHVLVTGGLDTLKNKILRWLGREIVVTSLHPLNRPQPHPPTSKF